ncbi:nuclear speckle RNA-binding protein B-like [Macadamia integrifolia]|uniref:nuclear speckle RNA-binding protein B-like n=1 Tax=Macadamia integrifolia TaxID=60698 RepID=UPI001C4E618E|nr:nuclear speckle RNA-binding protein B-like [Macadamia integrifolia]
MDSSSSDEFPTGSSSPSRKEVQIQGPRPPPLKVRKDSYKIKKPPLAPQSQPQPQPQPQPQQQPPRRPVIIYTVSPKVIHTTASDFMTLVQRLTGPNSTSSSSYTTVQSSSSSSASSSSYVDNKDTILASPAARFATIEKANTAPSFQGEKSRKGSSGVDVVEVEGLEEDMNGVGASGTVLERKSFFPGILSPVPSSLPPIFPNFFSPTIPHDPNSSLAFLQDLSPMFHGNRNFIEGTMVPSPTSFFSSAPLTSPTPFMDLFNQFDF